MAYPKGKPTWNKGLPKEMQPFFNKKHTKEDRVKSVETRKKNGRLYPSENSKKKMSETRKKLMRDGKIVPPLKLSDKISQDIIKLHDTGLSPKEIAEKNNCSLVSVFRYTKKKRDKSKEDKLNIFKEHLNNLDEKDKGYIAGIIDGEGSLIIQTTMTEKKPNWIGYTCVIDVSNQDIGILEFIHKKLGLTNKIYMGKREKDNGLLKIRIYGKEFITEFLNCIMPFIHSNKTKKRADILLKFCRSDNQEERIKLYYQMRKTKFVKGVLE